MSKNNLVFKKINVILLITLLIGVVSLIGVIYLGNSVTQTSALLQRHLCDEIIDKQLNNVKQALESASLKDTKLETFVNFLDCGRDYSLALKDEADAFRCNFFCSSEKSTCTLLHFGGREVGSKIKCVNIPVNTSFKLKLYEGNCEDRSTEKLIHVDWSTENIEKGYYTITSNLSGETPSICVYKEPYEFTENDLSTVT